MKEWLKEFFKTIGSLLLVFLILSFTILFICIAVSIILLFPCIMVYLFFVIGEKFGIFAAMLYLGLIYVIIDTAEKTVFSKKRCRMEEVIHKMRWDIVRNERANGKKYSIDSKESYLGHACDNSGRYQTYYLQPGIDNIARFICCNGQDKFLMSENGAPVLTTTGKFLDSACIPKQEMEILDTLINKYQTRDTEFEYKKKIQARVVYKWI